LEVASDKRDAQRDGRTSPALHSQQCAAAKHMHALTCPNSEFLHLPWDVYASVEGLSESNLTPNHPPTNTQHILCRAGWWQSKRLIRNTIIRACGTLRASTARQQQVPRCALARLLTNKMGIRAVWTRVLRRWCNRAVAVCCSQTLRRHLGVDSSTTALVSALSFT